VITIGIDPHSRTHIAAALDDRGRVLGELTVGSTVRELDRLARLDRRPWPRSR
jgi:transposase